MLTTILVTCLSFLALALLLFLVIVFNNLQAIKNNIEKAASNIKVLLKQRFDEIPQLVEICKAYMGYENKTLQDLTSLRSAFKKELEKNEDDSEKLKGMNELDQVLTGQMKSLYAVAESYPILKASEQFLHLQTRISALEDQIADRREFFNDSVNMYNTRIESLPDMFIAKVLNYKKKEMFTIEESETQISGSFNK